MQSARLTGAEFVRFAHSLIWQSPALASAFQKHNEEQLTSMSSRNAASAPFFGGCPEHDTKRLCMMMPQPSADVTATAHALLALNYTNLSVGPWQGQGLSKLPALQDLLVAQGQPLSSHQGSPPSVPASKIPSESDTPSPEMSACPRTHAPKQLAFSDVISKGKSTASKEQDGQESGSGGSSSPSTPPSRPKNTEKPPPSGSLAATEGSERAAPDGAHGRTSKGSPADADKAQSQAASGGGAEEGSAHNKYCHFCQHIKVKRASSMIACENRGCNRRFPTILPSRVLKKRSIAYVFSLINAALTRHPQVLRALPGHTHSGPKLFPTVASFRLALALPDLHQDVLLHVARLHKEPSPLQGLSVSP